MADRIKLLPDAVANQIAAGEVVNRPSSVVKEMMENAVDAGARNITVNFRDGGRALIQIVDDGCGMSPSDARLAFDKHATSKIRDVEDIYHLSTFGFRGEALASIASVAEVELRTRTAEDELGTRVEIAGGRFLSQQPVQAAVGSQFMVKNLFYNVPARRRFLEKSSSESRHIVAEYQRVALCHPEVAFNLYDNDTLVSQLPASGLRQRVVGVIGKNISKQLLDVGTETSIVTITGFVGRPASARQTNKEQFLFVNGRYFKSSYFQKAIVSAYEKLIPVNAQPSFFIYLIIDPERIDVNVHPQKTEVKFADGQQIWQILHAAVRESLAKSGAVPPMDFDMDTSVEIPVYRETTTYKIPEIKADPSFNPFERYGDSPEADVQKRSSGRASANRMDVGREFEIEPDLPTVQSEMEQVEEDSVFDFIEGIESEQGALALDGVDACSEVLPLGNRYAAAVIDGRLTVVDLRRAWEAVLYDKYMLMLGSGSSVSQQLLFPESVILSIDDYTLLREHLDDFAACGFDLSLSDEHTVVVSGLPADLAAVPVEEALYDLLDALREDIGNHEEKRRSRLAAIMARSGALSKTDTLSREAITSLLKTLEDCSNPSYTPSGHAVMTAFSEEEIKKRLK